MAGDQRPGVSSVQGEMIRLVCTVELHCRMPDGSRVGGERRDGEREAAGRGASGLHCTVSFTVECLVGCTVSYL